MQLLRFQGGIPEAHEDTIFKNQLPFEIFTLNANRLETWAHSSSSSTEPALDLLRETIELKKLNGNLMKSTLIDDLIGDTYARIYETVVPDLVAKAGEAENRERMRIDRMLMSSDLPQQNIQVSDGQPAAPSRPKAIGRTEVRRRAEALVSKIVVPPVQARGRASMGTTSVAIAVQVPANKHLATKDDAAVNDAISSVPGSVHDSADDESELSDIEEEEQEPPEHEPALLFPGLLRAGGESVDDGMDTTREVDEEAGVTDGEEKGDEGEEPNGDEGVMDISVS